MFTKHIVINKSVSFSDQTFCY